MTEREVYEMLGRWVSNAFSAAGIILFLIVAVAADSAVLSSGAFLRWICFMGAAVLAFLAAYVFARRVPDES